MTDLGAIFGLSQAKLNENLVERLGFPRNPFVLTEEDVLRPPFYSEHIRTELRAIGAWATRALAGERLPLSISGHIGVGKSRILSMLRDLLREMASRGVAVDKITITDSGYGKASLGALLVMSLERTPVVGVDEVPDNVTPLVWAVASARTPAAGETPLRRALARAQSCRDSDARRETSLTISRWLARAPVSAADAASVGLERRIDWEGALIPIVGDLLRCAREVGVLTTYFLLIDQLEDLFTKSFTELRRSRLLTDLRGLMDQIDEGMPLGLALTFGPEIRGQSTDGQIARGYAALASRIERNKIDLALFDHTHAEGFAATYIERLRGLPGFEPAKQPRIRDLVMDAWLELEKSRQVVVTGKTTPRDLLKALAGAVQTLAEEQ